MYRIGIDIGKTTDILHKAKAVLKRSSPSYDSLPESKESGLYTGNGLCGFTAWKEQDYFLFELGRCDYIDKRNDYEIDNPISKSVVFSKCRLPIGRLHIGLPEKRTKENASFDFWDACVKGYAKGADSEISFSAYTHYSRDIIVIDIDRAHSEGVEFAFIPAVCEASRARKPEAYIAYPKPQKTVLGDVILYQQFMPEEKKYHTLGCGNALLCVGMKKCIKENGLRVYIAIRYCRGEETAVNLVCSALENAVNADVAALDQEHKEIWHSMYQKSCLEISDRRYESFYQMQLYKILSAVREDGPALDLLGPWYMPTQWNAYWQNLNIQQAYCAYAKANHAGKVHTLLDFYDRSKENLEKNTGKKGCYAVYTVTGPDNLGEPGDHFGNLAYSLKILYEANRSEMDDCLLKEKLFPLLKGSFMYYYTMLTEDTDGHLVLPPSVSPEYGWDIGLVEAAFEQTTMDLALLRWNAAAVIECCDRLAIKDEVYACAQLVKDKLISYPIGSEGFMVAKDVPFSYSHRHWSHLFAIYPLYEYTKDVEEQRKIIEASLTKWVSMPERFTGFSWAAASCMYTMLGDGNKAICMLDELLKKWISPNGMYFEHGNPTIETPIFAARAIQDMVVSVYNGVIRIFPAVADRWEKVAFDDFLVEGGFLVSAVYEASEACWLKIKSIAGEPCIIEVEGADSFIAGNDDKDKVRYLGGNRLEITMAKEETIILKKR